MDIDDISELLANEEDNTNERLANEEDGTNELLANEEDFTNELLENEDDDTNVELSPAELIEMLEEVWINEKFAPEILPHKSEIIDCVLGQLSYMEKNLESLPVNDFKKGIHQLEVDRIRYVVTNYLRHRLDKIENYVVHILKQEDERAEKNEKTYLTDAELQFAKNCKDGIDQHIRNVTRGYPNLPIQNWRELVAIKPNMNSFVFLKAKTAVEGILIDAERRDESDVVDLIPNSQVIISYNSVANLLKNNDVRLI